MKPYQREFLSFAIATGVLRFGDFKLKSGRPSPYFFNAGLFNTGPALKKLGEYYAAAILDWGQPFDVVFGPAYKGIPLASAVVMALADHGQNIGYCFNRKENKDHGEGGVVVGSPLKGRVVIVDDVISAGLSATESVSIIRNAGADPVALFISLDRMERGADGTDSAAAAIAKTQQLDVRAIANLDDLMTWLAEDPQQQEHLAAIQRYREQYGA